MLICMYTTEAKAFKCRQLFNCNFSVLYLLQKSGKFNQQKCQNKGWTNTWKGAAMDFVGAH